MATFDPSKLNGIEFSVLDTAGLRSQAPGFDARSGEGARRFGGRFNPPRSFPVIYLCLTRACVSAELRMQAARQGVQVDDLLPRDLWSIATALDKVLDLTDALVVASLGVDPVDLVRPDHVFTQEIGEAAHERGLQGIMSPSATGVDQILAILPENLGVTTLRVDLVETWSSMLDLG